MYFHDLPSEIAGNRLLFPDIKQQLLEFVIEVVVMFGIVVVANGSQFIQKLMHIKIENPNSLHWVIMDEPSRMP